MFNPPPVFSVYVSMLNMRWLKKMGGVSEIEKLQLVVFDQNRFKCQSSLVGMQSAIIEAYFLKNFSKERISLMIPYVIKNC